MWVNVTAGEFETLRSLFRYYFKKVSDEFDCGVVFEEVREDDSILPIFEEKIIGKVEKIDWSVNVEGERVEKKPARDRSRSDWKVEEQLEGEEEVLWDWNPEERSRKWYRRSGSEAKQWPQLMTF